jgi:hypothetical protein
MFRLLSLSRQAFGSVFRISAGSYRYGVIECGRGLALDVPTKSAFHSQARATAAVASTHQGGSQVEPKSNFNSIKPVQLEQAAVHETEGTLNSHVATQNANLTSAAILDLGNVTNSLLNKTVTDYRILDKDSRLLFGALEKIVLTQVEPAVLLNDARFRLLFVTAVRRANQLSAVEFCELFSTLLNGGLLHADCNEDFVELRKLCVQVAFRLATLQVNRVSLSAQIGFACTLKEHETRLRSIAETLYDAFTCQLRLLIADKRDQFHQLTFDELAYVVRLFSNSTAAAEDGLVTEAVRQEVCIYILSLEIISRVTFLILFRIR